MDGGFFSSGFGLFLLILGQCLLVTVLVLVALAFLMYADRKIWAGVQLRRGEQPPGPVPTRTPVWDTPSPAGLTDPYNDVVPDGDHSRRGMWIRADRPLVAGEELSPFVRVALAADEGSPVAHRGETELEFINADYTLTLSRDPVGEYIGLQAGGHVSQDGIAVGHATVHDEKGPIGFSMTTAVANVRTV